MATRSRTTARRAASPSAVSTPRARSAARPTRSRSSTRISSRSRRRSWSVRSSRSRRKARAVAANGTRTFTASGGAGAPYTWATTGGTITSDGVLTAPGDGGQIIVTATDKNGAKATAVVNRWRRDLDHAGRRDGRLARHPPAHRGRRLGHGLLLHAHHLPADRRDDRRGQRPLQRG